MSLSFWRQQCASHQIQFFWRNTQLLFQLRLLRRVRLFLLCFGSRLLLSHCCRCLNGSSSSHPLLSFRVDAVWHDFLVAFAFLSLHVSVPLANELSQYHMKAFVASPGPGQMSKTNFWDSREDQNFHPHEFTLPTFQLCGRVLNRQQSSCFSFFVAVPSGGFSSVKSFRQMSHQGHFAFDY